MKLKPVTRENLELVRQWRNECMESLRTPYMLTEQQQGGFYHELSSGCSSHRYYELHSDGSFVGLGGLTYIQWENRCAEISLILSPSFRRRKLGQRAVLELYRTAFNELNLNMVFGECYQSNNAYGFWEKDTKRYGGDVAILRQRKYWAGCYWDSLYFSVTKAQYEKSIQQTGASVPTGL
jgi:RimJ/RimL family protein N-acetyltransferase